MNKEEFLRTELGREICITARELNFIMDEQAKISEWENFSEYEVYKTRIQIRLAKLDVFKIAIKQFYGIEYHFTRTDEYFGLVTEDETDWLLKIERNV